MDKQATDLNHTIQKLNTNILEVLSERGKNIFFPKLGILSQILMQQLVKRLKTAVLPCTFLNSTI
jgi:hypothetical protein